MGNLGHGTLSLNARRCAAGRPFGSRVWGRNAAETRHDPARGGPAGGRGKPRSRPPGVNAAGLRLPLPGRRLWNHAGTKTKPTVGDVGSRSNDAHLTSVGWRPCALVGGRVEVLQVALLVRTRGLGGSLEEGVSARGPRRPSGSTSPAFSMPLAIAVTTGRRAGRRCLSDPGFFARRRRSGPCSSDPARRRAQRGRHMPT